MKPENKPLWFEVYEAFPPRTPPEAMRPVTEEPLRAIFYPEDKIRAKFYERLGSLGTFDLKDEHFESESQKFVNQYREVQEQMPGRSEDEIFNVTLERMEGVKLERDHKVEDPVKVENKTEFKKSSIDVSKLW